MRFEHLAWSGIAVLVGLGGLALSGVVWNGTSSVPRGLWVERAVTAPLRRGDVVAACVHASSAVRHYIAPGACQDTGLEAVLKPVVAVEGDTVEVTEAGVIVNGALLKHSARLREDGEKRSLDQLFPTTDGAVVVPSGVVWLVAPMDLSFDSRYFGPVSTSSVIGVVDPLLTE